MITGWEIYWIMQLDSFVCATSIVAAVAGITALFATVGYIGVSSDATYESEKRLAKKLKKLSIASLLIFFVFLLVAVFTPSTKTAAMAVAIPRVLNNEAVQDEAKELYTIAKEGMKKLCEEEDKK